MEALSLNTICEPQCIYVFRELLVLIKLELVLTFFLQIRRTDQRLCRVSEQSQIKSQINVHVSLVSNHDCRELCPHVLLCQRTIFYVLIMFFLYEEAIVSAAEELPHIAYFISRWFLSETKEKT